MGFSRTSETIQTSNYLKVGEESKIIKNIIKISRRIGQQ